MLRKSILAVTATAMVAAVALAAVPAPAFAKKGGGGGGGKHHHHHHSHHGHLGFRVFSPPVYAAYDSCWRKRWISTAYGMKLRWVNVCTIY